MIKTWPPSLYYTFYVISAIWILDTLYSHIYLCHYIETSLFFGRFSLYEFYWPRFFFLLLFALLNYIILSSFLLFFYFAPLALSSFSPCRSQRDTMTKLLWKKLYTHTYRTWSRKKKTKKILKNISKRKIKMTTQRKKEKNIQRIGKEKHKKKKLEWHNFEAWSEVKVDKASCGWLK